jgi:hypothetical protein
MISDSIHIASTPAPLGPCAALALSVLVAASTSELLASEIR